MLKDKKTELHPRNAHSGSYNFTDLCAVSEELTPYVMENKYGTKTIDFANAGAVLALNKALLKRYYGIDYWSLPAGALTPPIPSRADYIHHVSDLLDGAKNSVRCLDIGVGANCIYPIIGVSSYGWSFVGTDTERASLSNAQKIVDGNTILKGRVELRLQADRAKIFKGVVGGDECFDIVVCNPPFHRSASEAERGSERKLRNLNGGVSKKLKLNFGGGSSELWCEGGERGFISKMIHESVAIKQNCRWFTALVSKEDNLRPLCSELRKVRVKEKRIIELKIGNKKSRILAWTFM